jgi:eukaryotic-like serine/threonine-protein kinase
MTRQRRNPVDNSQEPVDLFRSIKSKLAQRMNGGTEEGITVDLLPVGPGTPGEPGEAGHAPAQIARLGVGHVLRGRYVIEGQVGSGGMGTVYSALDRARIGHSEANAHVAIKVLHEQTHGRADAVSKLRREFYCAQALAHPSVIKVYELDLEQDSPFFTMELIEGENLPTLRQQFYPLPLPRRYVWAVIRELAAGLTHAHDRGVVHGDVKPQNVMVTDSGELRILDFGRSGDSATALTPAYASCELLEGREPDPRDDLFALACLSYELLAGEHPFQHLRSTEARTLKVVPRRPTGLSRRQWKALASGLAWDRADRPRSVRDWLAELNIGSHPLGPLPLLGDSKALPIVKNKVTYTLVGLLAAVLVGGIAWAVFSRPTLPAAVIEAAGDSSATTSPPVNVDSALADVGNDDSDAPAAAPTPSKAEQSHVASAARPIDKTERISVESAAYSTRPGEKFAEVRVQRSTGSKGGTSFEWWTEPGSALAETDYAPQAPTTTFFPAGKRSVSIFVKLLRNPARKRAEVFYVVIGNPSIGTALGTVSKAAVKLQP